MLPYLPALPPMPARPAERMPRVPNGSAENQPDRLPTLVNVTVDNSSAARPVSGPVAAPQVPADSKEIGISVPRPRRLEMTPAGGP
jgi:hypothetical protein